MKKIVFLASCLSFFVSCSSLKTKQDQSVSLKILSYNIRHGVGLDGVLDLSRSAKIVQAQAPDICGLQEIDNFCSRSGSVSQTDYLSQKTNMTGTFGKFFDYQGGQYGMATLSAKPLISTRVLSLPSGNEEARSSIVQEVEIAKGCTIVFANVHFDYLPEVNGVSIRLGQAKALVKYLNSLNKPIIISGDFNCTPESATMQYFAEQGFVFIEKGNDNLSFQDEEKAEIDHLIYRNTKNVKFKKKSIQLLKEPVASDHRPLVIDLDVIYN
jgi:endonuclease/exonuclease/phosphatase family metal-dependent hydrolase